MDSQNESASSLTLDVARGSVDGSGGIVTTGRSCSVVARGYRVGREGGRGWHHAQGLRGRGQPARVAPRSADVITGRAGSAPSRDRREGRGRAAAPDRQAKPCRGRQVTAGGST